jgi:hypothetical protein
MTKKTVSKVAKPARVTKAVRKPRKVDFDDESKVLKEIARCLDEDPSDLTIKKGSAPNGYGTAYIIEQGSDREYIVMENEDKFETAARLGVEYDLKDDPSMFNQSFVESHINLERLRNDLHSDVFDGNCERLKDEALSRPMEFLKNNNIDIPAPNEAQIREWIKEGKKTPDDVTEFNRQNPEDQWDEIGDEPLLTGAVIEEIAELETENQLKDPMDYLEGIYGKQEAAKQAIEIAGIDALSAAEEAVRTDGAAHFMCNYDGNYDTSPSGFVYWRHN